MMSLPVWLPGPIFIQGGVVSVQAGSPSRMGLRILLESFLVVEGFCSLRWDYAKDSLFISAEFEIFTEKTDNAVSHCTCRIIHMGMS